MVVIHPAEMVDQPFNRHKCVQKPERVVYSLCDRKRRRHGLTRRLDHGVIEPDLVTRRQELPGDDKILAEFKGMPEFVRRRNEGSFAFGIFDKEDLPEGIVVGYFTFNPERTGPGSLLTVARPELPDTGDDGCVRLGRHPYYRIRRHGPKTQDHSQTQGLENSERVRHQRHFFPIDRPSSSDCMLAFAWMRFQSKRQIVCN